MPRGGVAHALKCVLDNTGRKAHGLSRSTLERKVYSLNSRKTQFVFFRWGCKAVLLSLLMHQRLKSFGSSYFTLPFSSFIKSLFTGNVFLHLPTSPYNMRRYPVSYRVFFYGSPPVSLDVRPLPKVSMPCQSVLQIAKRLQAQQQV